jgi:sulfite reductase beta subunit-like hemoprotein
MAKEPSRNERIKEASDYLRGTLGQGLRDTITGSIVEDDAQLVKFHGMYLQDDRDLRGERSSNGSRSTRSRATTATAPCGSRPGRPFSCTA